MLRKTLLVICFLSLPAMSVQAQVDLFDVYAKALENDPRVQIAQQQVNRGKAREDSARGALLPQATAFANLSDNQVTFDGEPDQSFDGERYGFSVRQMLFNWTSISGKRRSAQVVSQLESELMDVMSLLLVDTSERYFNVLLAERDAELVQTELELVQQQLRQTEERYKRKLVRITDLLETQARADQVTTDLIEAENQVALARESLSELTGTYVGDLALFREDYELPELADTIDYWVERATAGNSILQSKRDAVAAAKAGVEEARGNRYPQLDLVYSDQTSDVGFDNQQVTERNTRYIGVDLTVPLFTGGTNSARVREAWASYYIAREEEEATRRDVLKRTREAWLNTRSSRRRIEASKASVASATKSYEAMSKSFTYGTVTATDVLEALHFRTRAVRDYRTALYEYVTNWLTLQREGGALDVDDLERLNGALLKPSS